MTLKRCHANYNTPLKNLFAYLRMTEHLISAHLNIEHLNTGSLKHQVAVAGLDKFFL